MRWVTRSHVHLDRVASVWLICRFIDPDASFEFVGWNRNAALPDGAIPFGLPGVELSAHDEHGTTFAKTLQKYRLQNCALDEMAVIVAAGVRWAFRIDPPIDQRSAHTALGRALDALGGGLGVFHDDETIIRLSMPVYDALYVHTQMTSASRHVRQGVPRHRPAWQAYWRERVTDPATQQPLPYQ